MKKKEWKDFEITKIELDAEEALLACCGTTCTGMTNY